MRLAVVLLLICYLIESGGSISISDAHRILGSRHDHGTVRLTSDLRWHRDSSAIDSSEQQRRQYRDRIRTTSLRHNQGRPKEGH